MSLEVFVVYKCRKFDGPERFRQTHHHDVSMIRECRGSPLKNQRSMGCLWDRYESFLVTNTSIYTRLGRGASPLRWMTLYFHFFACDDASKNADAQNLDQEDLP